MNEVTTIEVIDGKHGTDIQPLDPMAARLIELYREAQTGLRRVVALGLYCFEIKDQIKHGQFEAWLKDNVPDISHRALKCYMQLAKGVLEKCGFQMGRALPFCHGGKLLLESPDEFPPEAKELRAKICEVIDGKSQQQLLLDFKNVKENGDGDLVPATGAGAFHGKRELTPEEKLAEEIRGACELIGDAIRINGLLPIGDALHKAVLHKDGKKILKRYLETTTTTNKKIREVLKGAKGAKGQKGPKAGAQALTEERKKGIAMEAKERWAKVRAGKPAQKGWYICRAPIKDGPWRFKTEGLGWTNDIKAARVFTAGAAALNNRQGDLVVEIDPSRPLSEQLGNMATKPPSI